MPSDNTRLASVQDAVETHKVQCHARPARAPPAWRGTPPTAGDAHHLQVVGAVAHHDGLRWRDAEFGAHALHGAHLFLGVDDAADHAAGQLAVDRFEHVGVGIVQPGAPAGAR
jgi:hypothetical protein